MVFYLFVDVLIIIVAAVVISIGIQVFKAWYYTPPPPPSSQTNNVTAFVEYDFNGNQTVSGYVAPQYGPFSTQYFYEAESPSSMANGFTIQYGVDGNTNPWCAPIGMNIPQNEIGYVQTTASTGTNYQFTMTLNGIGSMTYSSCNTNGDSYEFGEETNGYLQTTDDVGDIITYNPSPYPQSSNLVIIQRSTNLVEWDNIYTDIVSPGNISAYTDTNIFWPINTTFYNADTNDGGGIGPPTDTNGVDTNGIISIPGSAFYRLAYPSNQNDYLSP